MSDHEGNRGGNAPERPPGDDELRELDRTLRAIRFDPRPSLAAETLARERRERPQSGSRRHWTYAGLATAALGAAAVIGLLVLSDGGPVRGPLDPSGPMVTAATGPVTLDRCCRDLDGGGVADDGLLIVAGPDESLLSLVVYEDRDGSGGYSEPDLLRAVPGASRVAGPLPAGAIATDHCCLDYDAGGPSDDGILLVGVPPDRVLLATLYEDRDGSGGVSAADLVRYVLR